VTQQSTSFLPSPKANVLVAEQTMDAVPSTEPISGDVAQASDRILVAVIRPSALSVETTSDQPDTLHPDGREMVGQLVAPRAPSPPTVLVQVRRPGVSGPGLLEPLGPRGTPERSAFLDMWLATRPDPSAEKE